MKTNDLRTGPKPTKYTVWLREQPIEKLYKRQQLVAEMQLAFGDTALPNRRKLDSLIHRARKWKRAGGTLARAKNSTLPIRPLREMDKTLASIEQQMAVLKTVVKSMQTVLFG